MTPAIEIALALVAVGSLLATWTLSGTTALSMTAFFMFGLPAYGLAMLLYIREVLRDLRRHQVL